MNTKPVRYHAVVSDLHFGDGGKLDDFVHEQELKTFLSYVSEQGRVRSGSAELVINGDFIDFLQVQPLRHGPWREAIDKVSRVAGAHPDTFEALGRFVKEGNRVVILPGNHDIELSFREVQEAFTALIAAGDPDVTSRIVFPNSEPLGSHFRGWEHGPFAYRLKAPSAPGLSVYIEHGNQFDVVNSFNHRKFFHESLADHIRMPWGSRFVLDILNDVEARFPYIDKIRPRHAALMLLWLLDPHYVRKRLAACAGLGVQLYPELRRYHREAEVRGTVGAGAKAVGPGELDPDGVLLAWLGQYADDLETIERHWPLIDPAAREDGSKGLRFISERILKAYASILTAALEAMTSTNERIHEADEYAVRGIELARSEGAEVVVFGHTHGAKDIRMDGNRYLNTGTWIGLVDIDYEALRRGGIPEYDDLLDRLRSPETFAPLKVLTFAEIAAPAGVMEVGLRIWRDGEARRAIAQ